MPARNAVGMNTELSTRVMAMTGPVISSMALMVASRGGSPLAIQRSMFSTTTMASSTTMPMASTRPKSVKLFKEKPSKAMTPKVPIERDGHVDHRHQRRPPVLQEDQHDDEDQDERLEEGLVDFVDRFVDEDGGVVDDLVVDAFGEDACRELLHLRADGVGRFQGVGAGQLEDGQGDGGLAVEVAVDVVVSGPQLDALLGGLAAGFVDVLADHVAEVDDLAVVAGLDDDVLELLLAAEPSLGLDDQLEGHRGAGGHGRLAEAPGRDLHVLLLDGVRSRRRRSSARRPAAAGRARCACCNRGGRGICTSPTPSTRARASFTFRAASCSGRADRSRNSRSVRRLETRLTHSKMLGDFFIVVTPIRLTSSGSPAWAMATRFCTSTWAVSRSVPSLKVTSRSIWPSLVERDAM